jgi:3-mercaptopyruvate sulfurtransferase SseA
MRLISSVLLGTLVLVAFVACNSTDHASKVATTNPTATNKLKPAETTHPDDARRINVQEAQKLIASGQAVVFDVRNQAAYDQGHIHGAKLIPFAEVADRSGEFPHDKTIITYCS